MLSLGVGFTANKPVTLDIRIPLGQPLSVKVAETITIAELAQKLLHLNPQINDKPYYLSHRVYKTFTYTDLFLVPDDDEENGWKRNLLTQPQKVANYYVASFYKDVDIAMTNPTSEKLFDLIPPISSSIPLVYRLVGTKKKIKKKDLD